MTHLLDLTAYRVCAPPIFPAPPEGFSRAVPVSYPVTVLAPLFPAEEALMGLLGDARIKGSPEEPIFASGAVVSPHGINLCMIAIAALKAATIEIQFNKLPRSYSFLLHLLDTVIRRLRTHTQLDVAFDVLSLHSFGLSCLFERHAADAGHSSTSNAFIANVYTNIYDKYDASAIIHACRTTDYYHVRSTRNNLHTTANARCLLNDRKAADKRLFRYPEMDNIHKIFLRRKLVGTDKVSNARNSGSALSCEAVREVKRASLAVVAHKTPPAPVPSTPAPTSPADRIGCERQPDNTSAIKEAVDNANFWRFADRMPMPSRDKELNIARKLGDIVTIN